MVALLVLDHDLLRLQLVCLSVTVLDEFIELSRELLHLNQQLVVGPLLLDHVEFLLLNVVLQLLVLQREVYLPLLFGVCDLLQHLGLLLLYQQLLSVEHVVVFYERCWVCVQVLLIDGCHFSDSCCSKINILVLKWVVIEDSSEDVHCSLKINKE